MDAPFPPEFRLLKRPEFRRVFDRGRSRADKRIVLYACPRDEGGPSRIGLTVGRKFGNSPLRNKFKRRVREAFRIHHAEIAEGHDFIVLPVGRGTVLEFADLEESLLRLSEAAVRLVRERGPRR
jgi:ribonuclease P protein component